MIHKNLQCVVFEILSEARDFRRDTQLTKGKKSERRMPRLSGGEEGRGKLRKGPGICKQELIRTSPNGGTRLVEDQSLTLVRANPGN